MRALAFLLLTAAGGGALAAQAAPDPDLPRPGLWEVTVTVVSAQAEGGELAPAVRDMIGRPSTGRRCVADHSVRVGDRHPGTPCVYTRVADSGPNVSRSVMCDDPDVDVTAEMETDGRRAPDAYRYRLINRGFNRAGHRLILTSELVEEGRRIGDCPS